MKKFFTFTAIILILLGVAGYAVWHFGTNIASEKIVEKVESTLSDEDLKKIKSYIENDPQVQEILNEAATTNPDTLPYQTKEEATRVLIKKIGVNRILDIQKQAQNGSIDPEEVVTEIESKLSEEEIAALKYVIYKELYQ